ncbi:type II secretion system protein [Synechococcus sp. Cruz-9H2]|uniref:PulJ/GspJ family protein n=1 Tax=unclassified Synechococcus TaxID=2626047 RepID=UPI0020CF9D4C|nr:MULTISPECIES: type II secretion system protein [unclassified Synechococcus]MCP9820379.1 type II secretion system protein [Synechococcus sp. Cruz-9H2]MCP9856809.1 type II secretion system protein [Synechococcus sp. Cruz-9C9]
MKISSRRILKHLRTTYHKDAGLTFLEVIVAVLILSIVSIGTAGLISSSSRQVTRSGDIQQLNALIESDLSAVRTANDRLVCTNGTCAISGTDPTRTEYFPAVAISTAPTSAEQININFFERRCGYRANDGTFNVNEGFATALVGLLPVADARLVRTVIPEGSGHRYRVRYTRAGGDNTILRQVTLVPATVAWCPCVPSLNDQPCPLTGTE